MSYNCNVESPTMDIYILSGFSFDGLVKLLDLALISVISLKSLQLGTVM